MSYPKSMSFAVSRLSGYSKQTTKLRPMSQDSANPGDVMVFEMPPNTLVDMRTFTVAALASTTCSGGTAPSCVLPKHVETLIDSIQVEINGVLVDSGFIGYYQLHKLYMDYLAGVDKNSTMRSLLQQGDLTTLGLTFGAIGSSALAISTVQTTVPVVFNSFLGFLASKCPIIDTSILGQVRVLIKLAPASVLLIGGTAVPTSYTYQLTKLFSTIDIISMGDGLYYDMIQQRLQQAPIEIMFDRYFVFQNGRVGSAQTTRWAVNTQSLDWVIGTLFHDDSRANSALIDPITNTSRKFKRTGTEVNESRWYYNGIPYPAYAPAVADGTILLNTLQNLNVIQDLVGGADPALNSYNNWKASFFAHVHRFNHLPSSDDDSRLISGLNTQGQNSQGTWDTTATAGATGFYYPQVWCKCTSTLQIGANRTLQVIA
jgi:hypothetical protein